MIFINLLHMMITHVLCFIFQKHLLIPIMNVHQYLAGVYKLISQEF